MNVLLPVSLLALLLAFLNSQGRLKYGLEIAFGIVTIAAALRGNYGNDYANYVEMYNSACKGGFSLSDFLSQHRKSPAWFLLNRACAHLSFEWVIALSSVIQNAAIYVVIKKCVPEKMRFVSLAIYLFCPFFYVLSMSMIRQSIAMAFFLLSLHYAIRKRKLISVALMFVAWTFHNSALVMVPVILFFLFVTIKHEILWVLGLYGVFALTLLSPALQKSLIDILTSSDEFGEYDYYKNKSYGIDFTIGMGFVFAYFVPFCIYMYYLLDERCSQTLKKLTVVASMTALTFALGMAMPWMVRVAYYFLLTFVITMPWVYQRMEQKELRYGAYGSFFAMMAYFYWDFFHNLTYTQHFLVYHSLFES